MIGKKEVNGSSVEENGRIFANRVSRESGSPAGLLDRRMAESLCGSYL